MRRSPNAAKIRKTFTGLAAIPYANLPGPIGDWCDDLADRVKANAPVDKGELKASVEVERPGAFNRFSASQNLTWAVVVNCDHAAAVEYGTIHTVAQPYFRRAIQQGKVRLKSFVKEAMNKGFRRIGGG